MRRPLAIAAFVAAAVCAVVSAAFAQEVDFGTPPSGVVPILFNDHHVYAKPDELKQGRLLAALIRGKAILVPLRSMFEQMGATVAYDPASQTVIINKSGSEITLTIGKPAVVIDGITRPLDVPPEIYEGKVLVPVRVITEALGGYVQYVPSLKSVVVRYLVIGSSHTVSPAAIASAGPAPTPHPRPYIPPGAPIPEGPPAPQTYVVVDDTVSSKVYDTYSPGSTVDAKRSLAIHGAAEFDALGVNFIVGGDADRYVYAHPDANVLQVDRTFSFVPAFVEQSVDYDAFLGTQIAPQPIDLYLDVAYTYHYANYGYPKIGGLGIGLQKVPNFRKRLSFGGSVFYYPNVWGSGTYPSGSQIFSYRILDYRVAGTLDLFNPIFVEAAYAGRDARAKSAPTDFSQTGPELGLGLHF